MARNPTGYQALEAAQADVVNATSLDQFRRALSVVLPLELGITLARTAEMIGKTPGWVARTRIRYISKYSLGLELKGRGGKRHSLLSPEDERKAVDTVTRERWHSFNTPVLELRDLVQAKLGRPIALSTAYNILNRVKAARKVKSVG